MLEDGADLLDSGGESTRPGAKVVQSGISAEEELRRIMPVLEDVLRERPGAVISVDTYKAEVARAAINAARRSSTTSAECDGMDRCPSQWRG